MKRLDGPEGSLSAAPMAPNAPVMQKTPGVQTHTAEQLSAPYKREFLFATPNEAADALEMLRVEPQMDLAYRLSGSNFDGKLHWEGAGFGESLSVQARGASLVVDAGNISGAHTVPAQQKITAISTFLTILESGNN